MALALAMLLPALLVVDIALVLRCLRAVRALGEWTELMIRAVRDEARAVRGLEPAGAELDRVALAGLADELMASGRDMRVLGCRSEGEAYMAVAARIRLALGDKESYG